MRIVAAVVITLIVALGVPARARAQSQITASVPRLITVTGTYRPASGQPAAASAVITVAVYAEPTGGAPLFQETQDVALDATGRYAVQLGATQPDGLPLGLFAEGQERWLGVQFAGPGEIERPRTRLTSVPYALRAADADTLGGRPASAYVLTPTAAGTGDRRATDGTSANGGESSAPNAVQNGTANHLARYVSAVDIGDSAVIETGGKVGIGTGVPLDSLHVAFNNTTGQVTGYAVQNLGNTAASYSGMLFYDQNGALGQFQGFNNVTHEYRINNIAKTGANTDGSINFMIGGFSRLFVGATTGVGMGTVSPVSALEVSNAVSGAINSDVTATSFVNPPSFFGRAGRGNGAAPTAVHSGDTLATFAGKGYGATGFSITGTGGMSVQAAQNWTDVAQATSLAFFTTPANAGSAPVTRMTIDSNGNVGLGTTTPGGNLEIVNYPTSSPTASVVTTYSNTAAGSIIQGRKARGVWFAPSAAQANDILASFSAEGYGTTGFGIGARGGMVVQAAENWTDAAQGAMTSFSTTPTGSNVAQTRMTIVPDGSVGVGTTTPFAPLEVVRTGANAAIVSTLYADNAGAGAFLATQTARGTAAAPAAVHAGDFLGALLINGYGTTGFNEAAAVGAAAAEDFTATASGSALVFGTTAIGSNNADLKMAVLPSGNVGIGTPVDGNGIPTATDKLQVYGDIRVGNANTNGCLMNFAGSSLVGSCASDRRYKKGITPFALALDRIAALRPVHFYWRADEFPDHHFGDSRAYGLIAQEVEQVLPELVVTHEDGYKAVDYSELPLLTIQAVKELKAENDALKARIAELERLMHGTILAGNKR